MKIKLRVWHIPQVPMDAFTVPVSDPKEAIRIMKLLADYDIFQFENNVKPDYSSAQGLEVFEDGEWSDWYSKDGEDIQEYMENMK
jgi:hypothetical protein